MNAEEIIRLLLRHLQDGMGTGSPDWEWCWNELLGDSQEKVKEVRQIAEQFLI